MNGRQLKSRRMKLNLTQDQLAFELGMNVRTIVNYESTLEDLPRWLELSISQLETFEAEGGNILLKKGEDLILRAKSTLFLDMADPRDKILGLAWAQSWRAEFDSWCLQVRSEKIFKTKEKVVEDLFSQMPAAFERVLTYEEDCMKMLRKIGRQQIEEEELQIIKDAEESADSLDWEVH